MVEKKRKSSLQTDMPKGRCLEVCVKRSLPSCRYSLYVFYLQVMLLWQLKDTFMPLCALLFGYTASKGLYIYSAHKTHTHTHTHLLLSLSITPSLRRALLQDFTCSEGCFPSFLDTDCLQCFFIICLHHWTLFSQHTLTLLPPGYFTVLLFTVSGTIYRKVSSSDISGWSCSC